MRNLRRGSRKQGLARAGGGGEGTAASGCLFSHLAYIRNTPSGSPPRGCYALLRNALWGVLLPPAQARYRYAHGLTSANVRANESQLR